MTREILCKLTDKHMMTRNHHQWELGVAAPVLPPGGKLCSESYYHCYSHPLLAVLLNPIFSKLQRPRLFTISASGERLEDNGLRIGFKTITLIKEIDVPTITLEQRVAFAILCAKTVYKDPKWNEWAERWLSGKDRSEAAAEAAAANAEAAEAWAANAAARAAANAANAAARAAANAAEAWAARARAMADWADWAAAVAVAEAEVWAARAASWAAMAAARAMEPIDLIAIACSAIAEY